MCINMLDQINITFTLKKKKLFKCFPLILTISIYII